MWNGQSVQVYMDPAHPVLDGVTVPTSDTSPANLMAETLADRLRVSTQGRGKVVALSFKARAAIPLAGWQGQAWWFDEATGKMVTSTWYAKEAPAWMQTFNARKLADEGFGKTWELLRPRAEYVDVAPTLSALLEMGMPASAEGKPRAEALTGR